MRVAQVAADEGKQIGSQKLLENPSALLSIGCVDQKQISQIHAAAMGRWGMETKMFEVVARAIHPSHALTLAREQG